MTSSDLPRAQDPTPEGLYLPAKMDYAAGLVFLPTDRKRRLAAQAAIADATKAKGLDFLGWRWALPDRNRKPSWPSGTLPWMIAETSAPEVTT